MVHDVVAIMHKATLIVDIGLAIDPMLLYRPHAQQSNNAIILLSDAKISTCSLPTKYSQQKKFRFWQIQ